MSLRRVVQLLSQGQVEVLGQIVYSSNFIFLVTVADDEHEALAIYKPRQGERPLWDFPHGTLCQREVAAYVLSQVLGWPLVPPTVLRNGPFGPGAFQLFIDAESEANYFTFREDRLSDLLPVALFDLLVNNADRKGGHLLLDGSGRIWAIDNALTFHTDRKLRTVIWDFAGQPIPPQYVETLRRLSGGLAGEDLVQLLSDEELSALEERLIHLLDSGVFPHPDPDVRQVPWPVI